MIPLPREVGNALRVLLALLVMAGLACDCDAAAIPRAVTCSGSCHHLSPVTNLPSSSPEQDYITAITCQSLCLAKYGISFPNATTYSVWPTVDVGKFQKNCKLYPEIEQCQSGCQIRYKDPTLKPNRCRDTCYLKCKESCDGQEECSVSGLPCKRKCRKPHCKKGCLLPEETGDIKGPAPLSPLEAPILTPMTSQNAIGHFSVSLPENGVPDIDSWQLEDPLPNPVSFLFKVVDPVEAITWYYWQSSLSETLKLTAFVCREVQVSFAVVSNANISDYSPATTVCVHDSGGLPSQVKTDTIEFSTVEDTRPGYEGYAVTTMSWQKPEGYQHLTSYTVLVVSTTDTCGGTYVVHQFGQLGPDATNFTFKATSSSKLPKFGCSYHVEIESHPPQPSNGAQVIMTPELTGPPPEMVLKCDSTWNDDGTLEAHIQWSLSNSTLLLEAIEEFHISQQPDSGNTKHIHTEENRYQYNATFHNISLSEEDTMLQFSVRPVKNSFYHWRMIPSEEACTIVVTAPSPAPVNNVTVKNYHVVSSRRLLLDVIWLPNEDAVTSYEVLVTTSNEIGSTALKTFYSQTVKANETMASIELSLEQNETTHCLHLWVRAYLDEYPGNMSTPLVLPRDADCMDPSIDYSFEETKEKDGKITVYYRSDNSTSKLVDITCVDGVQELPDNHYDDISTRLQTIEESLASISDFLGVDNSDPLDNRLEVMEQKLETILSHLMSDPPN